MKLSLFSVLLSIAVVSVLASPLSPRGNDTLSIMSRTKTGKTAMTLGHVAIENKTRNLENRNYHPVELSAMKKRDDACKSAETKTVTMWKTMTHDVNTSTPAAHDPEPEPTSSTLKQSTVSTTTHPDVKSTQTHDSTQKTMLNSVQEQHEPASLVTTTTKESGPGENHHRKAAGSAVKKQSSSKVFPPINTFTTISQEPISNESARSKQTRSKTTISSSVLHHTKQLSIKTLSGSTTNSQFTQNQVGSVHTTLSPVSPLPACSADFNKHSLQEHKPPSTATTEHGKGTTQAPSKATISKNQHGSSPTTVITTKISGTALTITATSVQGGLDCGNYNLFGIEICINGSGNGNKINV